MCPYQESPAEKVIISATFLESSKKIQSQLKRWNATQITSKEEEVSDPQLGSKATTKLSKAQAKKEAVGSVSDIFVSSTVQPLLLNSSETNASSSNSFILTSCQLEELHKSFINEKEIICTLCQRQFPNISLLRKHNELSNLHKSNFENFLIERQQSMKEEEMKLNPIPDVDSINESNVNLKEKEREEKEKEDVNLPIKLPRSYRDRAAERRRLTEQVIQQFNLSEPRYIPKNLSTYEEDKLPLEEDPENISLNKLIARKEDVGEEEDNFDFEDNSMESDRSYNRHHAIEMAQKRYKKEEAINEKQSNDPDISISGPGKALLLKMGWKEGQGLGKDSESQGLKVPLEAAAVIKGKGLGMHRI